MCTCHDPRIFGHICAGHGPPPPPGNQPLRDQWRRLPNLANPAPRPEPYNTPDDSEDSETLSSPKSPNTSAG